MPLQEYTLDTNHMGTSWFIDRIAEKLAVTKHRGLWVYAILTIDLRVVPKIMSTINSPGK